MQKVVTINLNGNAYQIDDAGYAALVAYLEGADVSLKDNPDRAEIVADLEQAIADKCQGFLGPHKTVVTAAEVTQIIREMGPVEGSASADASSSGASARQTSSDPAGSSAPRRLYLIHEGAMLAGVCNGLAAYVHVDVTIVRIVFLFLALVSRGGFGLVYLVLAFVIPPADTPEQRAAAHGQPFNARELIDRAKKNYEGFAGRKDWRHRWRREQRAWRRSWHASRWQPEWAWGPSAAPPGAYGTRILSGAMVPILSIVSVLFFCFWAWAVYSLVTSGQVLGQSLPNDVPFWVGILVLVCVYHAVAWPLHFARRRAAYYSLGGHYMGFIPAWDGALSLTFGILAVWMAYHYIPEVREVIKTLPDVWKSFGFE
ncbi:MAG TPA: PspC domain-containing protein [Vicinamibacterales bacterium]|nr:PspC domain-containing protein [Vicinamibacterales bacterium]